MPSRKPDNNEPDKTGDGPFRCPECANPIPAGTLECPRCSAEPAEEDPVLGLPAISGYKPLKLLGKGGMGLVYQAEDVSLGRKVAVKVILSAYAGDALSRARFNREARTMASVEHPNIVRVYAFGEQDNNLYLVTEYVKGEGLEDRIEREGKLPVADALSITRQVTRGLEAAWEKSIVHRDIKPSNILINRKGLVLVADFGLSKPMAEKGKQSLTGEGFTVGTPLYLSPEQARGQEVDFRTDVYSLGIVLYQMLAGVPPFRGKTPFQIIDQHFRKPLPSLTEIAAQIPAGVAELVEWMTQKEADLRPGSFAALLQRIDCLMGITPEAQKAKAWSVSFKAPCSASSTERPSQDPHREAEKAGGSTDAHTRQMPSGPSVPEEPVEEVAQEPANARGEANVEEMLSQAVEAGATQIHLGATATGYELHFLNKDDLDVKGSVDRERAADLMGQLLALAGLDKPDSKRSQTGSFRHRIGRREYSLRVRFKPEEAGRSCSVRLVRPVVLPRSFQDMFVPEEESRKLLGCLRSTPGLVVMAGPMDSGKLTCLGLIMQEAGVQQKTAFMVSDLEEDRLGGSEFRLPGVQPAYINRSEGVDLAFVLKWILRKDPAIVGFINTLDRNEMDQVLDFVGRGKTALIPMTASSTMETVRKLQPFGAAKLAALLGALSAQVLVRRLCDSCKKKDAEASGGLAKAGLPVERARQATVFAPVGCDKCRGTGYAGRRICLMEVISFTPSLRREFRTARSPEEFKRIATGAGMKTLRQWGLEQVLQGASSLEEVLASTPADT